MSEQLKIFDETGNEIGVADRDEVHKHGYWHETFQCWMIDSFQSIYFQKRSATKKDFPNLFDITAAGHLTSIETIADGVREIEEELGIKVTNEELVSLGVIDDSIITKEIIDHEFANVFLYVLKKEDKFTLQHEEVAGMVKADIQDFYELCTQKKDSIRVDGYDLDESGKRVEYSQTISLQDFVPHSKNYFETIAGAILKISEGR
ncbi:NUDIX hydrolase [Saliterribacillus persicus]|uniref:Isopentenyldiphosphate isomerase n=1 Tax=Saliterribacillus persicus TaxID=930114 RepID=A0A368Y3R0_9BACI|nr:NUDIX domain-containing protein [Saliterribacillus persicus]RCW74930.1 isopentenyldiphosphate isomerase [Saliterribacillus persicus]